ncbi:MAG: tRNA (N6-isopentenyl adenosine(37)-C2)-methylthiotransferase MiaB [Magnetococcales bacterium]|nr:tRNA (N6-isopentenyl adenosine(37)-C2)-methylthiotransferase MiaB [Magnetococcales bacterium]NGZ07421.1 tRNA (N6-isopentenyl adenosine(37)-C2)-methylthiotransferase MiaB [Magnetococcales bacterium]
MKRLHIKNFGCQMNVHDAVRMAALLRDVMGYISVEEPEQADLIILNTCHIREKAAEKIFSELGRLRKLVAGRPVIFAVGGCVGQAEGDHIFQRAPFVSLVFGPQNYHQLPEMLIRLEQQGGRIEERGESAPSKFDALPAITTPGPIASVVVQEGCNRFCTYCVVPFTRGREWSRPVEAIVDEARGLLANGARELHLLGQNVNAYQAMDRDGVVHDLALLLRRVALLPGLERMRFVTSHPADMNDDLVEVFGQLESLCPYLHLPIQSGSDRVLARMARGHTVNEYLDWIEKLRQVSPGIALASDFIVGFPGETEADFLETLELARTVQFDHAYSFVFSARPGTEAAEMSDAVPLEVGQARLARLQALLQEVQLAKNQARIGCIESVLVEGLAKRGEGELTGRSQHGRTVNFPGDPALIGHLVQVVITEGLPNSLRGRLT